MTFAGVWAATRSVSIKAAVGVVSKIPIIAFTALS